MRCTSLLLMFFCLGCGETRAPTKPAVVEKAMGPASGTLEDLFAKVEALPDGSRAFEMYVPNSLTMKGQPIAQNLAMALVMDRILAKKLYPDGFEQKQDGRLYRYTSELKVRK